MKKKLLGGELLSLEHSNPRQIQQLIFSLQSVDSILKQKRTSDTMAAEGQEDMLDFNAQKMDDQMGELLEYVFFFLPPVPPSPQAAVLMRETHSAPSKTTP